MNHRNYPLKIIIAVHHFPPTFKGGAEWRAHRTARWLQSQGHTVRVICVEAVNDPATSELRWIDEAFDGLVVRRLFLNLANAPDPLKWEYDNPWIEAHLARYLAEEKPDIFHLISGYLMTAAAIKAAKRQGLPVVLTLTDFWFLCQRHTLYRTSGQVCAENTVLDCVRCRLEEKRRFRWPAQKAPALTNAVWQVAQPLPGISTQAAKVTERVETLRRALGEVDVAICPSNFLKQMYIGKGFQARQMCFLRQGLAHIPALPLRKSPSAQLRIGYIGQIAPHKGVHVLLEAFLKLIQNSQANRSGSIPILKLYGDTSQFPDFYHDLESRFFLKNRIFNPAESIQFLGTFSHQQINRIYEELDVLVVPSIWYENSPNVILEALAHQTPVIASNLGGMAELVIDQQNGLLFEPNNPADLAQKLALVVTDPDILNRLRQNIAPPITLAAEMAELSHLYLKVLNDAKG